MAIVYSGINTVVYGNSGNMDEEGIRRTLYYYLLPVLPHTDIYGFITTTIYT